MNEHDDTREAPEVHTPSYRPNEIPAWAQELEPGDYEKIVAAARKRLEVLDPLHLSGKQLRQAVIDILITEIN